MNPTRIVCNSVSKTFAGRTVFKNISFELENHQSLCITGRNGSGKSTLVKIIAGLIHSSKGKVTFSDGDKELPREKQFEKTGFVSPYMNLYEELTGYENLDFFFRLRKNTDGKEAIENLLEKVGLHGKGKELLKNYSSGMKQRLKLAFAILHEPQVLIMDEPRTNLDSSGIDIMNKIAQQQKNNGILIIATNDEDDKKLCEGILNIEDYQK